MEIEKNPPIWKKVIIYIIGGGTILAFIYGLIDSYYFHKSIEENTRYTIGLTTRTYRLKSGKKVEYIYNVKGEEYYWGDNYDERVLCPNGRYFVKFSSEFPENSKILFNYPVPDTIITCPPLGWEKLPPDFKLSP